MVIGSDKFDKDAAVIWFVNEVVRGSCFERHFYNSY